MYVVNRIINGRTVKSANYRHFHGLLTNQKETSGPRRPYTDSIPLRCIYNIYDQPRIVFLISHPLFPYSVATRIPESQYYQFLPVHVEKFVSLNYDTDFDYIYTQRAYLSNHDAYVNSLIAKAKESKIDYRDQPLELKTHFSDQVQNDNSKIIEYCAVEGHQANEMEKNISIAKGLIDTYKIVRPDEGVAFCDEYFEIIRPYLRDDYFCWQRYVEK